MRVAFFADIHANLPALEAALEDARARGATHLINLGDLVGYGPEPAECLARVREVASASVLGNHDAAVCGLLDPRLFNAFARETAERAALALGAEERAWLAALPYVLEGDGFACAHGGFADPPRFNYLETKEDAALNLAAQPGCPLLVVGHTHIPRLFAQEGGSLRQLPPEDLALRPGARYVVNPGSIGFPRGERLTADYLLYDTVTGRLAFRAVPYDLAPYRLALVRNGYNPLNYWFLSPSARRRRAEQAFLTPPRSAPAPGGPFRPRRDRALPKGFWLAAALLGLLLLGACAALWALRPPADAPAAQAAEQPLLPPLSRWEIGGAGLSVRADEAANALTLTPAAPGGPCQATLLSPLAALPGHVGKLRLSFRTDAREHPGLRYTAQVLFHRADGSQRKDDLHPYKTPRDCAYTVAVPDDAAAFRVRFTFSLPGALSLEDPTLRVVE